jgi:hypothetical protein
VIQFKILGSPEEPSNVVTAMCDYEGHADARICPRITQVSSGCRFPLLRFFHSFKLPETPGMPPWVTNEFS